MASVRISIDYRDQNFSESQLELSGEIDDLIQYKTVGGRPHIRRTLELLDQKFLEAKAALLRHLEI